MRILVVDAERRVLDGIQRALLVNGDALDIDATTSGADAMERIASTPYDILVTSLKLPGVDGITLMEHARKRRPEMVRVVLSATVAAEEARRAAPLGHQFLAKPCTMEALEDVIARAGRLRAALGSEELRRMIGRLDHLPPSPRIYNDISEAMAHPDTDARALARIVARDPMVAAKVMQLANAPLFARARPVTDITEAVIYLGQERVRDLVLAAEIYGGMARGYRGEQLAEIQAHGVQVAFLAQRLAPVGWTAPLAFTAGLMHDVGQAVLAIHFPERAAAAAAVAHQRDIPFIVAERLLDGVTHADVGAYLLALWGLPAALVDAVANHHTPPRRPAAHRIDLAGVVHVADALIHDEEVDPAYARWTRIEHQLPAWRALAAELRCPGDDHHG